MHSLSTRHPRLGSLSGGRGQDRPQQFARPHCRPLSLRRRTGSREHRYAVALEWTGNTGAGTGCYGGYSRDHRLTTPGKPVIEGSSDPEEMLVGALAACHQLWYLHLCASAGIRVLAYRDAASGVMAENADGSGQFSQVTLRPHVTIAAGNNVEHARALHEEASRLCFIGRSIRFPIKHEPVIIAE